MLVEILDSQQCTLDPIFLGFPIIFVSKSSQISSQSTSSPIVAYIQVEDLRLTVKAEIRTDKRGPRRGYMQKGDSHCTRYSVDYNRGYAIFTRPDFARACIMLVESRVINYEALKRSRKHDQMLHGLEYGFRSEKERRAN